MIEINVVPKQKCDDTLAFNHDNVKLFDKVNAKLISEEYKDNTKVIKNIFHDLSFGRKLNYKKVLDLTELLYRYIANGLKIGQIVNGDKALEDSTYYHSINTAIYSMFIAKWLDLSAPIIKKIIQSGLLHDIGKAKVPDEILNKKGPLDRREMTIIQNHPIYGYEMIEHFHEIDPEIKSAILQHHQRLDGSGYPLDINSDCIGLYARIVAVADVFDAMTSDRVYKKRVEPYAAFQMFKTIGQNLFDKKVVNILIQNLDIKRNLDYRISSASLIGDANATVTRSLVKYSL